MTPDRRRDLLLEGLAVASILILAGVLRMGWPGITEFKADEARLLSLALDMRQGQFALRGISSSTGFPNFPMSVWLYSAPLLAWPHAYSATLFTGLLNTLAVAGGYWLVRRYWGVGAALAATLMFAVSPWAVIFSRKIWAQNLLPLMVIVWAFSGALAFVEGKRWYATAHIVALAVAIQTHLAAVALAPATLVYLIVFRRRLDWRALAAGLALSLLIAAPFLIYLAPRLGAGVQLSGGGETASPGLGLDALRYTGMITAGSDIHSLAGPLQYEAYLDRLPPMQLVYAAWLLLVVGGIAWSVLQLWRKPRELQSQVGLILLLWFLAPLVVFLWRWTPVHLHYFIATLPAPYMLAGIFFAAMLSRAGRWARGAAWAGLLVSAVLQVYALVTLFTLVATVATPGGFGTPLAVKLAAADRAREQLAAGASEILIAGVGSSPEDASFPAEFDALLYDVPRRFVDITAEAVFPGAPSVVVADQRSDVPAWATADLYQQAATTVMPFPARLDEGELLVLSLPGNAAPEAERPLTPPATLANWVTVLGSDGPSPAGASERLWQIHWDTGDNPDPAAYHLFNHVLDAQGKRLAQVDAPAFAGRQWRAGDVVVSRFRLPWPVENESPPEAINVGMYRYPDLSPISVLDEAANPAGETLRFNLAD